jgi:hypothetical protein
MQSNATDCDLCYLLMLLQRFSTVECMLDLLVGLEELKVSLLLGLDQHYWEK